MIEEAIHVRLTGWNALRQYCGDQVYPLRAPQNAAPPFITYQRISGPRLRNVLRASGMANPRIQIDVYAGSYRVAKAMSAQVRLAFDNYRGVITTDDGPVKIKSCSLDSDRDLIDPDVEPALHRVSHDFLIWHDE